jgi:fluoride exporter
VNAQGLLLVFLGGGIGSVLRYAAGLLAKSWFGLGFPLGTLVVNVLGGFLIGLLSVLLPPPGAPGEWLRLLLITGLLGGFTTFSAFSLEVVQLVERGAFLLAALYVFVSIALSLAAAASGWLLARGFAP